MGPALVLEHRVGALALDGEGDLLEAADLGRRGGKDLGPEAALLRVASEHLEQVAGKQRRLVAAGPGADLDQDVLVVIRIALHGRQADLLVQLGQPAGRLGDQPAQLRVVAVLGQELLRALQVVAELKVLARQLVRGLELPVLASNLRVALPIGDHLRVRHLPLQLREAGLDLLNERFDHGLSVTAAWEESDFRKVLPIDTLGD
jgi:hypothetical protein